MQVHIDVSGADAENLHGRWLMGWLPIVNHTGARGWLVNNGGHLLYIIILRCIKTGEEGWLATLSTPFVSAPVYEIWSSEGAGLQADTGT